MTAMHGTMLPRTSFLLLGPTLLLAARASIAEDALVLDDAGIRTAVERGLRIVEKAAVTWRGSYITLWRRDPAGWRVVVDLGRSENPL